MSLLIQQLEDASFGNVQTLRNKILSIASTTFAAEIDLDVIVLRYNAGFVCDLITKHDVHMEVLLETAKIHDGLVGTLKELLVLVVKQAADLLMTDPIALHSFFGHGASKVEEEAEVVGKTNLKNNQHNETTTEVAYEYGTGSGYTAEHIESWMAAVEAAREPELEFLGIVEKANRENSDHSHIIQGIKTVTTPGASERAPGSGYTAEDIESWMTAVEAARKSDAEEILGIVKNTKPDSNGRPIHNAHSTPSNHEYSKGVEEYSVAVIRKAGEEGDVDSSVVEETEDPFWDGQAAERTTPPSSAPKPAVWPGSPTQSPVYNLQMWSEDEEEDIDRHDPRGWGMEDVDSPNPEALP